MHGGEGEDRRRKRHMRPDPLRSATTVANSSLSEGAYFCKDGRKISVGDCALFQAEGSPPSIGIIRCLTTNKEDYPKLGVNWLYQPADVKFKGFLSAPNEVFYSFHRNEISAAFLLHPCKVAFLRKGIELPPGISSFVCRRVYDRSNKRLWWLTDKDYINEDVTYNNVKGTSATSLTCKMPRILLSWSSITINLRRWSSFTKCNLLVSVHRDHANVFT
ncbi:uncharacterized protein LOC116267760 [Nymphaea colorata]|nr:uncharacterized protein LOC116267760 [Nymphaea colorata]